jgi:hypothetical protein
MALPPQTSDVLAIQREMSALLRMKSNLLARKMDLAFDRLEELELEQRYSDNQPRGLDGRWVNAGARAAGVVLRRVPAVAIALAAYELYERLSAANNDKQQAVAVFNSRDYRPAEPGSLILTQVGVLTREETQNACPGLEDVERLSQQATRDSEDNRPDLRQPYRGTDIHKRLKDSIESDISSPFKAEKSFLKSSTEDVKYGTRGSVRVDVFEDVRNGTICVYDLKTGAARFDPRRGLEIATNVYNTYGTSRRIIITEVRTDR